VLSGAVFEPPAIVAGFDDVAVVGETVEQSGGHLCVAEDGGPFGKGEVGGDDDRGLLVELAHEVEEQLADGSGEGQVAELAEYDQFKATELRGQIAGLRPWDDARTHPAAAAGTVEGTAGDDETMPVVVDTVATWLAKRIGAPR